MRNLLNMALRVTGGNSVNWFYATGRVTNSIGLDVTTFAAPVTIFGSFQPVPRSVYQVLGLDFQKDYVNYFTSNSLGDVKRDTSPDEFEFNGSRYQCMSNTDWTVVNGWLQSMAVKIS